MATLREQLEARRAERAGLAPAQPQPQAGTLREQLGQRDQDWLMEYTGPDADGNPRTDLTLEPAGYDLRNPKQEPRPTGLQDLLRGLQIGTQASGRGIAGIPGIFADVSELALNAGMSGLDMIPGVDAPHRFQDSIGTSNWIADKAGQGVEAVLGEDTLIDREDMTPDERVLYMANQLGAESAVGSQLIRAFKDSVPRSLSAPFEAAGSDTRVVAGDTAAGIGSGTMMGAYEEKAPEEVKEKLGIFGDLIAGLIGGVGGAGALRTGEVATEAGRRAGTKRMNVPESEMPRDPETMLPVKRYDMERAAAMLQDQTIDPARASREIEDYLAAAGEGPDVTGALASGDPGLLSIERKMRSGEGAPDFIEADRKVMNNVSDKLTSVRPDASDPQAARNAAATSIEEQLARSRSGVNQAETAVSEQDAVLADLAEYLSGGRSKDQASRDLDRVLVDETYLPARDRKNDLYNEAARDPDVVVGTENVRARAGAELDKIDRANPVLRDTQARNVASAFAAPKSETAVDALLPSTDTTPEMRTVRPLADVIEDRASLGQMEDSGRSQSTYGDSKRGDTAREIRKGINEDVTAAAESGVPGTEKLAAADSYYKTKFAPYFRDGNVSPKFFAKVGKDKTRASTPPEATAGKFLVAGPNSRAAAEDVAQILDISPSKSEGVAAATAYVMADAAGKVVRDGKIRENPLARFISEREGMFSQLPGIKARFDELLEDVRAGNAQANGLADELTQAVSNAKLTERQINQSALKLIADAEPRKAVAGVFSSKDPTAKMKEAVEAFSVDPAAAEGWKAAVSDYLAEKATTASKAAVSGDRDAVSLPALQRVFEQNRKALAEVFSPEEMNILQQAQTRLEALSKRGTQASSGSATAENLGSLRGVIRAFASPVGLVTLLKRGALQAGSVEKRIKAVADQFPDADAAALKILNRAMLDPVLTKHLLDFPTSDAQVYNWSKKLNQLIFTGAAEDPSSEE